MTCKSWRFVAFMVWLMGSIPCGGCATLNGALAVPLSDHVQHGDTFMGIRLLGALRLPDDKIDGLSLAGISGLAWDQDDGILYALSDLGRVFHLRPMFVNDQLSDVEILAVHSLKDVHGRALVKPWKDAEGLTVIKAANGRKGDTELIVSFEVKQRIRRYTNTGQRLGGYNLPKHLSNIHYFAKGNLSLESVTRHPQWGLLVAPEVPMRINRRGEVRIYTLKNKSWRYPLHSAPGSSLVAMETLGDGSLLALERAYVSLTRPLIIALRRTRLPVYTNKRLNVQNVAVFDTSKGWLLDNFEGLTQHHSHRFFIISDDNRSFLQSTVLVYFELLEEKQP